MFSTFKFLWKYPIFCCSFWLQNFPLFSIEMALRLGNGGSEPLTLTKNNRPIVISQSDYSILAPLAAEAGSRHLQIWVNLVAAGRLLSINQSDSSILASLLLQNWPIRSQYFKYSFVHQPIKSLFFKLPFWIYAQSYCTIWIFLLSNCQSDLKDPFVMLGQSRSSIFNRHLSFAQSGLVILNVSIVLSFVL